MRQYDDFLAAKAIDDPLTGLADVPPLPDSLFPHQRDIVTWALRRGRAALFAGTGMGQSQEELATGLGGAARAGDAGVAGGTCSWVGHSQRGRA